MKIVIILLLVLLLILFFVFKNKASEKFKSIKNTFENKEKIIRYFGGDYCPYSNIESNAYKVMKDFEEMYGDKVSVKYYWVGPDNQIMQEFGVEYVPSILNGQNEYIELSLPENTNTENLSNDDLKSLLLETIYNKL